MAKSKKNLTRIKRKSLKHSKKNHKKTCKTVCKRSTKGG